MDTWTWCAIKDTETDAKRLASLALTHLLLYYYTVAKGLTTLHVLSEPRLCCTGQVTQSLGLCVAVIRVTGSAVSAAINGWP